MKTPAVFPALFAALLIGMAPFAHAEEQDRKDAPPREKTKQAPDRTEPRKEQSSDNSRTWLGIATTPVADVLREHLALDDGFGIQIQETLDDSPAEEAGLQAHDILVKFEDQMLISPEHLSLLVRRKHGGDKVSLTVIRQGKEMELSATLGETDELDFGRPHIDMGRFPPAYDRGDPRLWQESVKRKQDHLHEWMEKNRDAERDTPRKKDHDHGPEPKKEDVKESRPPGISLRPGFPVRVFGTEGVVKIDNQEGEVTITRKEGEHRIEIRDKDGAVVHDGEYDPEAGVGGLPEKAREQLKTMKLEDLEILSPRTPDSPPEKTSCPGEEGEESEGIL